MKKAFDFSLTRISEINSIIQTIKVNKAKGPDCIPGKFVRISSEDICTNSDKIYCHVINVNRNISERNL